MPFINSAVITLDVNYSATTTLNIVQEEPFTGGQMSESDKDSELEKATEEYVAKMTRILSKYQAVKYSSSRVEKEIAAVGGVLEYLSQRWVIEIIALLAMGDRKFNELKNFTGKIGSRTLTDKLRMLEKAGYVKREIVSEAPVRIRYSLTDQGRKLALSFYPLFYQIKRK